MIGQRYGKLVVEGMRGCVALCRCDCGVSKEVQRADLRRGFAKSCGCGRAEGARRAHGHAAHGKRSPTYRSWQAMRARCGNPKEANWPSYGGRGVTVCERWSSFEAFLEDMGERPAGLTLDRIDVDGGYEPSNCRWLSVAEQNANRRKK